MAPLRILFLGDVVGEPGLRALEKHLPAVAAGAGASLVVANGENVAAGLGLTAPLVRRMLAAGVHVVTTGNHVWDKKEFLRAIDRFPQVVRPANYPPGAPGKGWCTVRAAGATVAVVNLSGRVFMEPMDCPFRTADAVLGEVGSQAEVVLVDFHAEATSEKRALGWYLDGRVSAVVGTHTHVATADPQILPGGTGYITDAGMTGVASSVIGLPVTSSVERFRTRLPQGHGLAQGQGVLCGVLLEVDAGTGRCRAIERVEAPATHSAGG